MMSSERIRWRLGHNRRGSLIPASSSRVQFRAIGELWVRG
jgi:hypothetical protein